MVTDIEINSLYEQVFNLLKENGISKNLDIEKAINHNLSYDENKNIIFEKVNKIILKIKSEQDKKTDSTQDKNTPATAENHNAIEINTSTTPISNDEKRKLILELKAFVEKKGYNSDKIDFEKAININISYTANKNIILEKLKNKFKKESDEKATQVKIKTEKPKKVNKKELKAQELLKAEQIVKELENERVKARVIYLENLSQVKNTDRFYEINKPLMKDLNLLLKSDEINSLIVISPPAHLKTTIVEQELTKNNFKFEKSTGHLTPLEMVEFLFNQKDNFDVLVFDEFGLTPHINTLKQALSEERRIQTKTPKLSPEMTNFVLPKKLKFIFLLNQDITNTENQDILAVLSRCNATNLKYDYDKTIDLFYEIIKMPRDDKIMSKIPYEERVEVVNWVANNTSKSTKDLNIRLLNRIFNAYYYDKDEWIETSLRWINNDEEQAYLYNEFLKCFVNATDIKDVIKSWKEITGLSRATFFNFAKKMSIKPSHYLKKLLKV